MTRSDLDVGSSAMPIQTEGAKWIFNEDKVPRLSLQRLHNCKIFTEHFLCSVAMFHRHTTLSCQVSCRYPHTHAVWGVIFHRRKPTPTPSLAHCNRYQLSQNTSVLPLPASPLSDRFSHPPLYPLLYFCTLCFFSCFHCSFLPHLIFLPASTSSAVMHCCRGHLLCPSLFMIPTFSTLAQKDTSMKYSPAQLAVKWFTQTCLSCVCDLYLLFSCLHWSYLICLLLSGTKHGIPAVCYSMSLLVLVIYSSCWERTADAHLLHHFGLQMLL